MKTKQLSTWGQIDWGMNFCGQKDLGPDQLEI
jgi:hypothetical protein